MNENSIDNIPTLTDIIESGDAAMKDHFADDIDNDPMEMEAAFKDEDEAINLSEDEIVIAENFKTAETEIPQQAIPMTDELKDTINELVSEALRETMPVIEASFKRKLSRQIIEKLSKQ